MHTAQFDALDHSFAEYNPPFAMGIIIIKNNLASSVDAIAISEI